MGGYNQADREAALAGFEAFLAKPVCREDYRDAFEEYWGPFSQRIDAIQDAHLLEMTMAALEFWFMFDFLVDDDTRMVDLYLQYHPELPAGQERYLRAMGETTVHLYEVSSIRPSVSLVLRDLMSDQQVEVRERLASQSLRRWDVIAARILPNGPSGATKIERGVLHIPRLRVPGLLQLMREERADYSDTPEGEKYFYESLPPLLNEYWVAPIIAPQLPTLVNFDGDPVVLTEMFFEIANREQLCAILDQAELFERGMEGAESWVWSGQGQQRGEDVCLGRIEFRDDRLVLATNSQERAERGRALLEGLSGNTLLRYLATTTSGPQFAFAEQAGDQARPLEANLTPETAAELQHVKEEYYQNHYRAWLDDSIPMLDGKTPRQAAGSEELRPRVVEMLKDLEEMYERSLADGEPGFDPSWMWGELGLEDEHAAPRRPPPLMGHESLEPSAPGLSQVALDLARAWRTRIDHDPAQAIDDEYIRQNLGVRRYLQRYQEKLSDESVTTIMETGVLLQHLEYMCNFEIQRRKVFWVDEALSWLFGTTDIEVTGEHFRMPFSSFALMFTDRYALGLGEKLLMGKHGSLLRGRKLEILTVYVVAATPASLREPDDEVDVRRTLKLAFVLDACIGIPPELDVVSLTIEPGATLDSTLVRDSRGVGTSVSAESADSIAVMARTQLCRLVANAILYITSAEARPRSLPADRESRNRSSDGPPISSENVVYLPGTIDITARQAVKQIRQAHNDGELLNRFLVRGHWRRANPSWKDQRPRWVKPYWRGPKEATIVEKQYRLKP